MEKVLEMLGANSINPVRDIQLQMLAAMRQAVNIPIDIHTENPKSTGGFIRHYEVPEMIRIASPIYLKTGGSVAATHSWESTEDDAKNLIETFIEEKDQMIARAKNQEKMIDSTGLDEFVKSVKNEKLNTKRQPLRKSRKDVTKEDIKMIEALGGTIDDLLK